MNFPIIASDKSNIPIPLILKTVTIITLVIVVTLMHYLTTTDAGIRHVIFRELYFLPIILAGFWFGLRGGLSTALIVSIFYAPLIFSDSGEFSTHDFGNTMATLLFILIGGLLGWLKDRENAHEIRARKAENLAAVGEAAAMIAHDLKTPLILISGLSRRLTSKISSDNPEGEKVTIIRQQAERLEQMVADILLYARPMKLSPKSNDLFRVLREAKEAVSEIAGLHGVRVEIPSEKACECNFEFAKVLQAIINLLTNAIEVSPHGETVRVFLNRHNGRLQISVVDKGPGVPADIAEKIFEPFVTGKKKGTGLGLPISKKIIEAHAGKLECRNNPDAGATFKITIPV
jgi:signal transduction histidine kinase